ncbi:2 [Octopus vulgaris]|uniref:2 n=1 Tax=Octopus vulgaris TaxID=6645 RepID=A0AA36BT25_OCTVU|nr:2 [Octopus vulgaris] [Octopus vulgaris]
MHRIVQFWQITSTAVCEVGSAGPEMVWKIFDAVRLEDKRDASVFIFEKRVADKLHKPRRRETVAEILRKEVHQLQRIKHPKILQVFHTLEECHDSLAFACEPVQGSLANLLGNYKGLPANMPGELKECDFIEIEIKYGILQIAEALSYLHTTEQMLHRNISPQSILLTRRGGWKMAGLGFAEKALKDGKDSFQSVPWTPKMPKMAQPDLNYMAPEIISDKTCTSLSDIFSLGMVVCALYNSGHPLIEAEHSVSLYLKKLEQMHDEFGKVAHKMPIHIVEPVEKMINRDIRYRPTAQAFALMRYFHDPIITCLQCLDLIELQDATQKSEVYASLVHILPTIPKKIIYKHIYPILLNECRSPDITLAMSPLLGIIELASREEYSEILINDIRYLMGMSKPIQATAFLLDKLHIILAKSPKEEIKSEVLPMVFNTLDSNSLQGQEAALNTIAVIKEYVDDQVIKKIVLPRAKNLFARSSNVKMKINALTCIKKLLDSLDKMIILDEVLPFLTEISCQDAEVVMSIVGIYSHLLSNKRFGLTHNLVATKVMPPLIPHTVNPGLTMDQFTALMEVLRQMLGQIDTQRRHKMKMETVPTQNRQMNGTDIPHEDKSALEQERLSRTLLSISDAVQSVQKSRTAPSTPDLHFGHKNASPRSQRRNHSLLSLGSSLQDDKCTLDKPQDVQRRYSLVPPTSAVPGISLTTEDNSCGTSPDYSRRPSAHSLGTFNLPEMERRGSRGSILSGLTAMDFQSQRRSSFQSIGESVMQLFSGK